MQSFIVEVDGKLVALQAELFREDLDEFTKLSPDAQKSLIDQWKQSGKVVINGAVAYDNSNQYKISSSIRMRFDPALTLRIRKYKDAKYFFGRRIRWMIEDENGIHVYCDQCGNIANAVLYEQVERYRLKVPICKGHAEKWLEENPDYEFLEQVLAISKK